MKIKRIFNKKFVFTIKDKNNYIIDSINFTLEKHLNYYTKQVEYYFYDNRTKDKLDNSKIYTNLNRQDFKSFYKILFK